MHRTHFLHPLTGRYDCFDSSIAVHFSPAYSGPKSVSMYFLHTNHIYISSCVISLEFEQ